jgi:hypothetical protein
MKIDNQLSCGAVNLRLKVYDRDVIDPSRCTTVRLRGVAHVVCSYCRDFLIVTLLELFSHKTRKMETIPLALTRYLLSSQSLRE